jgi:hypothetical protein
MMIKNIGRKTRKQFEALTDALLTLEHTKEIQLEVLLASDGVTISGYMLGMHADDARKFPATAVKFKLSPLLIACIPSNEFNKVCDSISIELNNAQTGYYKSLLANQLLYILKKNTRKGIRNISQEWFQNERLSKGLVVNGGGNNG